MTESDKNKDTRTVVGNEAHGGDCVFKGFDNPLPSQCPQSDGHSAFNSLNKVVLCLGSNTESRVENVARALRILRRVLRGGVMVSRAYLNESYNGIGDDYINQVVMGRTILGVTELERLCNYMERKAGRRPHSKAYGIIALDIDIVVWNSTVVRPFDFSSPHFTLGYQEVKK